MPVSGARRQYEADPQPRHSTNSLTTLELAHAVPNIRNRMCFDDYAWEQSETISDTWVSDLFKTETLTEIGDFMIRHRKGVPVELCQPRAGAFNVSFRMKYQDGGSSLIRFPKPGATMSPEEKVRNEVAVMRYIPRQYFNSCAVHFALGDKEAESSWVGPVYPHGIHRSHHRFEYSIEHANTRW